MRTHQRLAFALLDALIREDAVALDEISKSIDSQNLSIPVLGTVSALLCSALTNAQGVAGALAVLDQAKAQHYEWST